MFAFQFFSNNAMITSVSLNQICNYLMNESSELFVEYDHRKVCKILISRYVPVKVRVPSGPQLALSNPRPARVLLFLCCICVAFLFFFLHFFYFFLHLRNLFLHLPHLTIFYEKLANSGLYL